MDSHKNIFADFNNLGTTANVDLVSLSHLRWDFVYQRPQHLMTRFAKERRVFFFEEPVFEARAPRLVVTQPAPGVWVVVPHLPPGKSPGETCAAQTAAVDRLLDEQRVEQFVAWYYTPM